MSEIIQQQQSSVDVFRGQLGRLHGEFAAALPQHVTPDRLVRTTMNAIQAAQKPNGKNMLLEADRMSLLSAVMTSAVLGLEPDGVTGQGYLLPFKGKVQFIPGYKGLITLAFNAGFAVEAHAVYENDIFSYQYGLDPKCNHAPAQSSSKRGEMVATYATARSNVVPPMFRVLEMEDILAIRNGSSGYRGMGNSSPWATNFPAMAMKSAVRALASRLPLVTDDRLHRALNLEPRGDAVTNIGPDGDVIEGDVDFTSEG